MWPDNKRRERKAQSVHVRAQYKPVTTSKLSGEPTAYDPQWKGPVRRRGCTDIIFLIVFIVFLAGWVILASLAFKNGDINRVIYPSDSSGNICGSGKFENKPYVYFFDLFKCKPKFEEDEWIPTTRCRTPQVCVEKCPTKTFSVAQYKNADPPNTEEIKKHMVCIYDTDMSKSLRELTDGKNAPCAYYYISSVNVAGRCFPSPTSVEDEFSIQGGNITIEMEGQILTGNQLVEKAKRKMERILNARRYIERLLQDLSKSWRVILIGLVAAMVLALIWIVLMRFAAGLMIWLGILGILALLVAGTSFSWYKFISLKGVPGADEGLGFSRKISYYTGRRQTWLVLGILSSIFLSILLLVIICLRERVRIATALIKEAANAIGYMPTALVFPVFPYLLELLVLLFSATVALMLMSLSPSSAGGIDVTMFLNTSETDGSYFEKCVEDLGGYSAFSNKTCSLGDKALSSHVNYSHLYNIFGFFWLTGFIVAYGEMTLAAAVASYYWTRDKGDIPTLTVASAMWTSTRYHLGTLAFGSLIIAIVSFIRAIIEYIERKLKTYENEVTKAIVCCCRCFCWCLENFLRFVNRNAYIMTAIYGENFCTSARKAFMLLMRNIIRVVVVDKVTDFLLLASKLVVVGSTSAVAYYVFSGSCEKLNKYIPELNYPLFPVLLVAIGAYVIATCFFDVYNMAVDTLFLCFLEDCERHDGSREKPYFMSKELMRILKKHNVKPSQQPTKAE